MIPVAMCKRSYRPSSRH